MKAWHFLRADNKLGFDDGRLVRVGHTFKCNPDSLALCVYGFHGSVNIMDALQYAPGPVVCRVELSGRLLEGDDKIVASKRTVIAMADATNVLDEMACWSAERALKLLKNPDPRSVAAIDAKRKWLRGEISDKELDAARAAASAAAWAAARAAASAAARDAARDAAWAAARDAARDAAWAAARDAQRRKLTRECNKLLRLL